MTTQLVPEELLHRSKKILFITHLAIGDFTYLQNFFQAFSQKFPHIEIHIWVDELRRTSRSEKWASLKKYSLYDWLHSCEFITKVYDQTYSPELFQHSQLEAQREAYPITVSLSTLRTSTYVKLARNVCPNGFVVGIKEKHHFFSFFKRLAYSKLDASLYPKTVAQSGSHITAVYAYWFKQILGVDLPAESRFPFVNIPEQWSSGARQQLDQWGFLNELDRQPLIFINAFAKTHKRCWELSSVAQLIAKMRTTAKWSTANFIVNVMPDQMSETEAFFSKLGLENVQLFTANENFFQLPAILAKCDLIISVETAVMHLANAVHVSVIALMRQKNPEWVPFDQDNSIVITTKKRKEWVAAIKVDDVLNALQTYQHR
jgi:heptosyltransferase III